MVKLLQRLLLGISFRDVLGLLVFQFRLDINCLKHRYDIYHLPFDPQLHYLKGIRHVLRLHSNQDKKYYHLQVHFLGFRLVWMLKQHEVVVLCVWIHFEVVLFIVIQEAIQFLYTRLLIWVNFTMVSKLGIITTFHLAHWLLEFLWYWW